jgi:hypothetical protein
MDSELFEYAIAKLTQTRLNPVTACKLCGADSLPFDIIDFNRSCGGFTLTDASAIPIVYRRCSECEFIFTDCFDDFTPDMWRKYVYNEGYSRVDPEYKTVRPRINAHMLRTLLSGRKHSTIGLDYGGGNGTTSALLRSQGWVFDSYDPFDQTNMDAGRIGKYNFCSAIEVFEHSPNPIGSLQDILSKVSGGQTVIMIGTSLTDGVITDMLRLSWWYAAPRNGHVSLYSSKSLKTMASRFNLEFFTHGRGPHFLFRGYTPGEIRRMVIQGKLLRRLHFLNIRFYRRLTRGD